MAHEYMYNGPMQIDSSGFQYTDTTDVLPVHEYHKQRLVELKAIAYFQYRFKNIANDSGQRRLLIDLMLTGKCPPAVDWTSPHINDANPVVVDLWCELEFKDDWEAFFARQNSLAAKASQ